jgi:transketolase
MKATRESFGETLVKIGNKYPDIVVLDAEVKNSTYTSLFKKEFPDRFFDCFIAEQNMVAMSVGMARMGKIPFVSTFSAFLTRAYDQIRMAGLGESNIKLVGSHAGVSIGEDGSSQMALEDITMMRPVWNSVVLYPSDDVSTAKLTEEMVKHKGLCFMRTTRAATPTIYKESDEFPIGGFKVHRLESDEMKESGIKVTIVAAGITLHEALKAQKELEGKVLVTVVDLYSIKPIEDEKLLEAITTEHIITVEDHWHEGGIGDAILNVFSQTPGVKIHKLAVTSLPHSGTPEENLQRAGIDSLSIQKKILTLT